MRPSKNARLLSERLSPKGISRPSENLRGTNINVAQLSGRIRRLEVIAAQRESAETSELYTRALDRLSRRDRDLLLGNTHRLNDPDCPRHLTAVWSRFGAIFREESEKQALQTTTH